MKSFTRVLLLLLLVVAPVLGVVATASANTELVPASRLVAPFIDISSGRDTFLVLTNVSRFIPLTRTPFSVSTGSPAVTIASSLGWGVHLEFYDQTCSRTDRVVDLSPQDVDQLDFLVNPNMTGVLAGGTASATQSGVAGRAFIDIDVRTVPSQTGDPSVQANVLLGTVVISDFANDFALAYPAASSIGSAQNGIGNTIVTRDGSGTAVTWTGRYEAFPPRVMVPGFFAEGTGTGPNAGQVFTTFWVMAAPADGNWSGIDSNDPNGDLNTGEAPGQGIGDGGEGGLLISGTGLLFDGCEHSISKPLTAHYLNNSLGAIFGTTNTDRANWTKANCDAGNFPGLDEFSGQAVGWVDFTNNITSKGTIGSTRPTSSTTGGIGVNRKRGIVGVFVENIIGGTPALHLGDVTRLWGDCSFTGDESVASATKRTCTNSGGGATETTGSRCQCSLADTVCHLDTAPTPSTFPTGVPQAPFAGACDNTPL